MIKRSLIGLTLLALISLASFVAMTKGQILGTGGTGREIELISPVAISNFTNSSFSTGDIIPRPMGTTVQFKRQLVGIVQVPQPIPGLGTIDVYFESSADNGQTWQDFASVHVTSTFNGTGNYYVPLSIGPNANWPTTVTIPTDRTINPNTILTGSIGDRIRATYRCSWAANQPGTMQLRALVIPD